MKNICINCLGLKQARLFLNENRLVRMQENSNNIEAMCTLNGISVLSKATLIIKCIAFHIQYDQGRFYH